MYNVCTLYTTAVGVISPRQLACYLHRNKYDIWCNVCWETLCSLRSHGTRDKAGSIIDRCYRERWFVDVFCSLRSHGTRLLLTQQSKPCLGQGRAVVRAITYERLFIRRAWYRKLDAVNLCDIKRIPTIRDCSK